MRPFLPESVLEELQPFYDMDAGSTKANREPMYTKKEEED